MVIFNGALKNCKFPTKWKVAKVCPNVGIQKIDIILNFKPITTMAIRTFTILQVFLPVYVDLSAISNLKLFTEYL